MTETTTDSDYRCALIIFSSTIIVTVIIVIGGLCVRFLIQGSVQQVILIALICVLVTVGVISLTGLWVYRRRIQNIEKKQAVTSDSTKYKVAPSAPPESNTGSWRFSKGPSSRTTIQA